MLMKMTLKKSIASLALLLIATEISAQEARFGTPTYVAPDARARDLDMNDNTFKNLASPQEDGDLANKRYVDETILNAALEARDNLGNHIAEQDLQMENNPIRGVSIIGRDPSHSIGMSSTNFIIGSSGGYNFSTAANGIDLNNNRLSNIPNPTQDVDIATKAYVDALIAQLRAEFLP